MACVFALRPVTDERLLPQLAAALERREELYARALLPDLWQGAPPPSETVLRRRGTRRRIWGLLLLVLGVLLFAPGLAAPRELPGQLAVGAVALGWGAWALFGEALRRKPDPDAPARRLLEALGDPSRRGAHAIFTDAALVLETPDGAHAEMGYGTVACALETRDLLLLADGARLVILQKSELTWGEWAGFREFLADRVGGLEIIPDRKGGLSHA